MDIKELQNTLADINKRINYNHKDTVKENQNPYDSQFVTNIQNKLKGILNNIKNIQNTQTLPKIEQVTTENTDKVLSNITPEKQNNAIIHPIKNNKPNIYISKFKINRLFN